jgi:hypothetical protein
MGLPGLQSIFMRKNNILTGNSSGYTFQFAAGPRLFSILDACGGNKLEG